MHSYAQQLFQWHKTKEIILFWNQKIFFDKKTVN